MSALPNDFRSLDPDSIEYKVARAHAALEQLLRAEAPVCVSWSAGKDSSTVLNLLLTVAAELSRQGVRIPPIVVTHADTGIENPAMVTYARNEMRQVDEFARAHSLDVRIHIAHPTLNESWVVRVIGGRGLPSYPSGNRDCATLMKVWPMKRLRKQVMKDLQGEGGSNHEPVVLLGTRYEESATRAANMRERGESDIEVRRGIDEKGKASHLFLSPVAFWSSDDIWTYLSYVRDGTLEGYSSFEETMRVYSDAMGVSCVIVAEDMSRDVKSSKACGSRFGCHLCTAGSRDASMENMLERDPRYAYMRPLNSLRNFLSNVRWDMDRRSWLGRTIKNGYIRIAPDAFSPAMMEELLRYALTIDADERAAARREGIAPRFQLVDLEQLFAIDAMWSLQAFHKPFHALAIWDEITNRGRRYPVPDIPVFSRPKELPERYMFVGRDWEDGVRMAYTGLRSAMHEFVSMDNQDGCMGTRALPDGRSVMDVNTGLSLEFDVEACCFILDDLPRLLREHHDKPGEDPTFAYHYYARLGVMSMKAGMQGEVDEILRRSAWKVRQGVAGEIDGRALWGKGVSREAAGLAAAPSARKRGADGSRSISHLRLIEDTLPPAQAPASPSQYVFWLDQDETESPARPRG